MSTSLPQTLSALASSLVVARSLLLIGSLQLLLLATAAAALAARLMVSQREEETALLSARGVARGQLARASLAEVTLLAVTGAVAGVVLGSYLANLLMSASGLPADSAGGLPGIVGRGVAGGDWWPAAVIMVLVTALVMWSVLRPATPGAARLRRGRQAVLATAAQAGLDAALIGLAVLAFWELRRYSAVPRLSGGSLGIDPVLSVAPVLALAGAALLPLRLLPAAARLLDRASARGRRLTAALASWQVSRRPVREGGPVLLVVLAVATGTLVLAQHQSWRQSQLDQAAFATGADVRASLATPLPLGRTGSLAHARGVLAAMPVSTFNSGFNVYALDATKAAEHGAAPARSGAAARGRALAADHPGTRSPGPDPAGQAGPARHYRHAQPAAGQRARRAVGEPVGGGRLGHRLLGPGREPARRRPLPPADRQSVRRAGALSAAPAGHVAELPDARLPAPSLRQPGGPAGRSFRPSSAPRRPAPRWPSAPWRSPRGRPAASPPRSPRAARCAAGTPRRPPRTSPTRWSPSFGRGSPRGG